MLTTLLISAALAGPADKTIDRIIEAHGGTEALAKVHAYRLEGTIEAAAPGTFVRIFELPGSLDVTLSYPHKTEHRVLIDGKGWRNQAGGFGPVQGILLDSMTLQAGRAAIPWVLDERRRQAQLAAPFDDSGAVLRGVAVPLGDGLDLQVWMDPDTGRVRRSEARMATGGMNMAFTVMYADYRQVAGVWFPFQEETSAGGTPTSRMTVTAVEINPSVGVNAPPESPLDLAPRPPPR